MVYRCQGMADNCGFCLELPDKYNCGWCNDQCDVQEKCSERNANTVMWLNKQQTCPDPQIINFYPKSGPFEGGTNITIEGINLGRNFKDIEEGVHIALLHNRVLSHQIPCIPFRESYVKTSQIKCQIQHTNVSYLNKGTTQSGQAPTGHIVVKVLNEYQATSRELFSFVNPKISHIEPSRGPTSGGTKISIVGSHMDAGSLIEASLGSFPCNVIRREKNRAECITSARFTPGGEKVRVRFDNGVRTFEDYTFLYVEDPTITLVESSSGQRQPKGIPAGGITVTVKGTNLNSVQRPLMYVEIDGVKYNSSCVIESSSDMKCKSPRVPEDKLKSLFNDNDGDHVELDYGFIMDDVQSVRSLATRQFNRFSKFLMYPNPVYYEFTEDERIKYYKSDYLTINVST